MDEYATLDAAVGALYRAGFEMQTPMYLDREDAEFIVDGIATGKLIVPRDGSDLIVDAGSHTVVVRRDRQRRGLVIQHASSGKVLARLKAPVCRWCAGDGVHPHLPERKRQILAIKREVWTHFEPQNTIGLEPSVRPAKKQEIEGPRVNFPFASWWELLSKMDGDRSMYPPYEEMVCPRCKGEGF